MRGFTLIEAIIYIALLGIVMTGAVAASYQILTGANGLNATNTVGEEGNFVLRKLEWAMSSAQSITTPGVDGWGSALHIVRYSGLAPDVIDICIKNQTIWIREDTWGGVCGDNTYQFLTTSNVKVGSLGFHHIPSTGSGPEGLEASTTIQNLTFSTTKYLRK